MVMTIDCRSRSSKPWQVPKKCQPQGLPDRKAGNSSACARPAHPGRGHRPCHSVPLPPGQPGAQSPRPAPAPPQAGASRPPGRALASCCAWTCRSTGHRPARAGKRMRFLFPPGEARKIRVRTASAVAMAGAIAHATAPRRPQARRGPKAPGQRPHRHRRALVSCGVGGPDQGGTVPQGRGNAVRFRVPPRGALPFPGSGCVSRQAGGRIAFPASC